MVHYRAIPREFYERDPEIVAKELLGKFLVRRLGDKILSGRIVETEAYYGSADPASRAYHGLKTYNKAMWGESGVAFIYNVHKYWMFNVVAHESNQIGAALIRAIEPVEGINLMKQNRKTEVLKGLTTGPGKLTLALRIVKDLNGTDLTDTKNDVFIADSDTRFQTGCSHRIGVTKDLEKELRFYIKGNIFVSK